MLQRLTCDTAPPAAFRRVRPVRAFGLAWGIGMREPFGAAVRQAMGRRHRAFCRAVVRLRGHSAAQSPRPACAQAVRRPAPAQAGWVVGAPK